MKTCCAVGLLLGLCLHPSPLNLSSVQPLLGHSQAQILPVMFPGDLGLGEDNNSLCLGLSSSSVSLQWMPAASGGCEHLWGEECCPECTQILLLALSQGEHTAEATERGRMENKHTLE